MSSNLILSFKNRGVNLNGKMLILHVNNRSSILLHSIKIKIMISRSNSNNLRLMINKDWISSWFCEQNAYSALLQNDIIIYKYFFWHQYFQNILLKMRIVRFSKKTILFFLISDECEKNDFQKAKKNMLQKTKKTLLKKQIFNLRNINISLFRTKKVFFIFFKEKYYKNNSFYIARKIATLIENKVKFRSKIIKNLIKNRFIKNLLIVCKGRLNGVEMAKKDFLLKGSIPFQKFSFNLNFSLIIANTIKGLISVRVWTCLVT